MIGKRERDKRHDAKRRNSEHRKLYKTEAWKRARAAQLAAHPLCERHKAKGRVVAATAVHHRVPHHGNTDLFFDPSNLESICKPCHDGEAQQVERIGYSTQVDSTGFPEDPNHPFNR